jgi:hypothetical protein
VKKASTVCKYLHEQNTKVGLGAFFKISCVNCYLPWACFILSRMSPNPNDAFESIPEEDVPKPGKKNDEPSLTPDQRAELNSWVDTFRSEWQVAEDSDKTTATNIRDQLKDLAEDAFVTLRAIIKYSQNESLKFRASTWLLDSLLSEKGIIKMDDPLYAFLEEMRDTTARHGTSERSGSS